METLIDKYNQDLKNVLDNFPKEKIKMSSGESSSDSDVVNTEKQQKEATNAASNAAS